MTVIDKKIRSFVIESICMQVIKINSIYCLSETYICARVYLFIERGRNQLNNSKQTRKTDRHVELDNFCLINSFIATTKRTECIVSLFSLCATTTATSSAARAAKNIPCNEQR